MKLLWLFFASIISCITTSHIDNTTNSPTKATIHNNSEDRNKQNILTSCSNFSIDEIIGIDKKIATQLLENELLENKITLSQKDTSMQNIQPIILKRPFFCLYKKLYLELIQENSTSQNIDSEVHYQGNEDAIKSQQAMANSENIIRYIYQNLINADTCLKTAESCYLTFPFLQALKSEPLHIRQQIIQNYIKIWEQFYINAMPKDSYENLTEFIAYHFHWIRKEVLEQD
ncbi:MAG: hypothetical protein R3B45_11815 [Bdellovibrionota bacterium]